MQIHDREKQSPVSGEMPELHRSPALPQAFILAAVTLAIAVLWTTTLHMAGGDADQNHYIAMAHGQREIKPFALRFLAPAAVHLFAGITGEPVERGFRILGFLSGWILLYGVLSLVLRRRQGLWLALVLTAMPFWLRTLADYHLPDLPHAALCMIYLLLLRRRWWGWASAMLAVMFLARESTLLIAAVAIPVLWRLAGRRAGLLQLAAALAGIAGSKLFTRHALPNHQNMNDTLYMIGKVPWNLSRNVFGVTLWSNTEPIFPPVRVWNLPPWLRLGDIHQVGYSSYRFWDQAFTLGNLLSCFGIGLCVVLCLWWRTPLRALLPRSQPWLCVAALYGAAAYLLAPVLGNAETRLFDYGWPLFLVYLPAVMLSVWRNLPRSAFYALLGLNLIVAWAALAIAILGIPYPDAFATYLLCNLLAAWLLLKYKPRTIAAIAFDE